jgi:hypothetical protein
MPRLTKKEEAERYLLPLYCYCFKLVFKHFDVNASVFAITQKEAEEKLNKMYKDYDSCTLVFISNRTLL